jgi:hypothetical protein
VWCFCEAVEAGSSSDAFHYLTAGCNLSYRFTDQVVAARVKDGSLFAELDELEENFANPCFVTAHDAVDESCGLVAAHTYSVLDLQRVGDVRLVQVCASVCACLYFRWLSFRLRLTPSPPQLPPQLLSQPAAQPLGGVRVHGGLVRHGRVKVDPGNGSCHRA